MPDRSDYVNDDVEILYRLRLVQKTYAQNFSAQSVDGTEQMIVTLYAAYYTPYRIFYCLSLYLSNLPVKVQL